MLQHMQMILVIFVFASFLFLITAKVDTKTFPLNFLQNILLAKYFDKNFKDIN